ncbi:MAG: RodZ domain-containing protein [Bacillota bacterium]
MGIGEQLSTARKSRGVSLEAAEEATKIRVRFLEALENEEFSVLPGRVYAKAFLRSYARFLGLDDAALAQEFDAVWAAEPEPPVRLRRIEKVRPSINWGRYTNLLLVAAVIGLLLAFNSIYKVVFGVSAERRPAVVHQGEGRPPAGQPQAENPTSGAPGNPQPPAQQPQVTQPGEPAGEVSPGQGVTVTLEAVGGQCWVRLVADGRTAFEGMLEKGAVRSFTAEEKIQLRLGNAGAVMVSCNGQDLGKLGGVGEVVTREFSAGQG